MNSVGVFLFSQDWRRDDPSRYVTIDEARVMRKSGKFYSINNGKDIAEAGEAKSDVAPEFKKMGWRVMASGSRRLDIPPVQDMQLV